MLEARYKDISSQIAEGIKNCLWKDRLPGVVKLSKELKANPATIVKALKLLADKGLVTIQGTKGTFITQPNNRARRKVIGVVGLPNRAFHAGELASMEERAAAADYRLIGISHNDDFFTRNPGRFLEFPVDGYIFMYSTLTMEIAAFLREKGISFASCNNPVGIPGVNWVDFDSEGNFEKALRHLISLGHKSIAYIEFDNPNYRYSERILAAYQRILAESGLPFAKALFISEKSHNCHRRHGEKYLRQYGMECANRLITAKEKPTAAVMAINSANGFVEVLSHNNMEVPADFSIITYNDARNNPDEFFTTISVDYEKRAIRAVEILLNLLDDSLHEATQQLIEGELIEGKSCGAPPQKAA